MSNYTRKAVNLYILLLITTSFLSCNESDSVNFPPEWIKTTDDRTGVEGWQLTNHDSASVACYFERQAFSGDDKYFIYSSVRSGDWKLYRVDLSSGNYTILSPEGRVIHDDDYTVHPDGQNVCYFDEGILYATNIESGKEEILFDLKGRITGRVRFSGSFTNDGEYTLFSSVEEESNKIYRVNLHSDEIILAYEKTEGRISHPLINPVYPYLISFVPGPDTQNDMTLPQELRARNWLIDISSGIVRQFLTREKGFRATHETWSTDGERFFFFQKTVPGWLPVSIYSMDKNGDNEIVYYSSDSIRLGHGISDASGKWFISDSQEPGTNPLTLINLETGKSKIIDWPNSSMDSGDGKFSHVHPFFSSTGNYIGYTSDKSGIPQVYVVPVAELVNEGFK